MFIGSWYSTLYPSSCCFYARFDFPQQFCWGFVSSAVFHFVSCLVFEDFSKARLKAPAHRHGVTSSQLLPTVRHVFQPPHGAKLASCDSYSLQFHSKFNSCSFSTKHRRLKIKSGHRMYYLALRQHSGAWFGIQMGEGSAVTSLHLLPWPRVNLNSCARSLVI